MRECGNQGWRGVRSSEAVESEQLEGEMYDRCAMATWWPTPLLRSGWSRIGVVSSMRLDDMMVKFKFRAGWRGIRTLIPTCTCACRDTSHTCPTCSPPGLVHDALPIHRCCPNYRVHSLQTAQSCPTRPALSHYSAFFSSTSKSLGCLSLTMFSSPVNSAMA